MGWKDQKEIIAKCKEIAPGAFVDKMPVSKVRNVVIDDCPTRLRFRKGPNGDYMFTGDEYYRMFSQPMRADLADNTDTWIACFDISQLMPRAKIPEQKERRDKKVQAEEKKKQKGIKLEPLPKYDVNADFCEGGLRSEDGTFTQRFNLTSVTLNSKLWTKLMLFCEEMLMMDPLPVGRSVIMQHLPIGPLQFIRIHDQQANACFQLNNARHPFGEADMQLGYWVHIYASTREQEVARRPENIEVRTTDSDALGILCNVVALLNKEETKEKRTRVYWNRGKIITKDGKDKGNHKLICINELVHCLEKRGMTVEMLLIIAHTFGSDYAKKDNICPRSTFKSSGATILKHQKDLHAVLIPPQELVKRDCFAVWDHLMQNPSRDALEYMPDFFKGMQSRTKARETTGTAYDVSKQALEHFVWKFPGCKDGKDVDKGCQDVFWAAQYHCFPFNVLEIDRPSNFIEVEDC